MRERDIINVGAIQYQFDAHQNLIALRQGKNGEEPEVKRIAPMMRYEERSLGENPDVMGYSLISLREITTAPISAANKTSEASSNGSR